MFKRLISAGVAIAAIATAVPATAQSASDDARFQAAQARFQSELARFQAEFNRYRSLRGRGYDNGGGYHDNGGYRNAPVPSQYQDNRYAYEQDEGNYDPSRYYRSGPQYQERVLSNDDRVYAGSDGRYYCRRSDGTTGLIVGGAAGGILGNVIDGGHSRIVGTLLGGAVGAIAGKSIDQNSSQVRCR